MSWDKNTINMSIISDLIVLLVALKMKYKVTEIQRLPGRGNNDGPEDSYILKKLEVNNMIYIDQMLRTSDCDTDDTIITHRFNKKSGVPKNFKAEIDIEN